MHRDHPGLAFGFHRFDPSARPASSLPQKQDYYQNFLVKSGDLRNHRPDRLPTILRERLKWAADDTLPSNLLLALLPAALLGLRSLHRCVVVAIAPTFVLLYVFYPLYLPNYSVPLAVVIAFCIALAASTASEQWATATGRRAASVFFPLAVACLVVTSLPEIRPHTRDGLFWMPPGQMIRAHDELARLHRPSVVLFRYRQGDNSQEEPVYNSDVAWPDDAQVIRAQDLGPERDVECIKYYSGRRPVREFYLYDRQHAQPLVRLGTTKDSAAIIAQLSRLK